MKKTLVALCLAFVAVVGLGGCATTESTPAAALAAGTVVIDVRTPEEFAAGHLEGALNIDVTAPTFDSEVSQLPTDGTYVLYCRSGSRAAAALTRMQELGFTQLSNAGSLEEAGASTGLATVTGP